MAQGPLGKTSLNVVKRPLSVNDGFTFAPAFGLL